MASSINNNGSPDHNVGRSIDPKLDKKGRFQQVNSDSSEVEKVEAAADIIISGDSQVSDAGSTSSAKNKPSVDFGGITVHQLNELGVRAKMVVSSFKMLEKDYPNIFENRGVPEFLLSSEGERYLDMSMGASDEGTESSGLEPIEQSGSAGQEEIFMSREEVNALVSSLQLGPDQTVGSEEIVSETGRRNVCSEACRSLLEGIRRVLISIGQLFARLKILIIDFLQRLFPCLRRGGPQEIPVSPENEDLAQFAGLRRRGSGEIWEKSSNSESNIVYSELDLPQPISSKVEKLEDEVVYAVISDPTKPSSSEVDRGFMLNKFFDELENASQASSSMASLIATSLNSNDSSTSPVPEQDTDDGFSLHRAEFAISEDVGGESLLEALRQFYGRLTEREEELRKSHTNVRAAFAFWKNMEQR